MNIPYTKRARHHVLLAELKNERSSFESQWRELGDYLLPSRPRFSLSDKNKGDRKNLKIIDAHGVMAVRTCRSGMMSGITSPARPWFGLTVADPELAEYGAVKQYLHTVTQRIRDMFLGTNLYKVLPQAYGDLVVFGTAPIYAEEDRDKVLRFESFPIGSYYIASNAQGMVNVFAREFSMTVRNIVHTFGKRDEKTGRPDWSVFSTHVKSLWDQANYETWVDVCHIIEPNSDFDPKKAELYSYHKQFSSCYFELGTGTATGASYRHEDDQKYLRESGYDLFPILCPRWEVSGEDVYATSCPGMAMLGDNKQLQLMQRRKAEGVEKMVRPPMVGPAILKQRGTNTLPGGTTFVDTREGMQGFQQAQNIQLRLAELREDIQDIRNNISRACFEDLFLMLSQSDRRQVTAREIEERHEEKLLALGPVLEQLNGDALDPLMDISFHYMNKNGLLPEPPEELQGMPLKVEYQSIMARAQKLIDVGAVDRFTGYITGLAQIFPDALAKVNADELVDEYAQITSMPPKIVRTDEEAAQIKNQAVQAQQAQASAEMAAQATGAAKNLSQTDLEGDNALSRLLNQAQAGSVVPQ